MKADPAAHAAIQTLISRFNSAASNPDYGMDVALLIHSTLKKKDISGLTADKTLRVTKVVTVAEAQAKHVKRFHEIS